jgi:hypothetical protein
MGETGIVGFPGNLDPRAQEFRPRIPSNQAQVALFRPLPQAVPQVYYPFSASDVQVHVQVVPFCEGGVGYGCQLAAVPPAYVSAAPGVGVRVQAAVPAPSSAATRTLVLSSVPGDVSEGTVRRELEGFGEVRGVQMERIREGIVTVHFYDLRHAEEALSAIRDQHMQHQSRLRNHYLYNSGCSNAAMPPPPPPARGLIAGRTVWAQFSIPSPTHAVREGHNQGTIVIFNLDSQVSKAGLKEIFETFGGYFFCFCPL